MAVEKANFLGCLGRIFPWVAGIGIAFCLWVRLAYPTYIPFIADEPLLQMILDDYLAAGTFPLITMRGSSIPLAYGAGALWIYSVMRAVFSSLEALAFLNGLLYSAGLFSVMWVLRGRAEKKIIWLIGWFAISAPILFFLARLVWDSIFFVPLTGLMLVFIDHIDRKNPRSILAWVGLGLVAAIMFNIHLMISPVLLAGGATAVIAVWRSALPIKTRVALPALALFVFALVVAPYLVEAVRLYYSEGVASKAASRSLWGDGRNLWWLTLRSFVFMSIWKAHDLYGIVFTEFREFCGALLGGLFYKDILGWIPKFLAIGYVLSLPVRLWRGKRLSAIQWLILLAFSFSIFFFNLINIPMEAHYFHGMWWLGFLAVGLALSELPLWPRRIFFGFTFLSALINTVYIVQSARFVAMNEGMRNHTYGTTMREIRGKLGEACREEPSARVAIYRDEIFLLPHPVRYFNRHLPECAGKELVLVPSREEASWVLKYAQPSPSAALALERLAR